MEYEKIHACSNDCVLYRKELKDASSFPTCRTSRWKINKTETKKRKGVPAKVMWFALRFQDLEECFNHQKLQKSSYGMPKKEIMMGNCITHLIHPHGS